ncbi:hypothetical protein PBS_09410 [Paraburkholderia sp. 2C]
MQRASGFVVTTGISETTGNTMGASAPLSCFTGTLAAFSGPWQTARAVAQAELLKVSAKALTLSSPAWDQSKR